MENKREIIVGIYKITNKINGKVYIGQSVNIYQRWQKHKRSAINKSDPKYHYHLYCAFRKYGIEHFDFEILEKCNIAELDMRERYWIRIHNSFFNGYNQTLGGDGRGSKKIEKEYIVGIFKDLENNELNNIEIAKKWNVSADLVSGINNGRFWRCDDKQYPIRVCKNSKNNQLSSTQRVKDKKICPKCGKEMDYRSVLCAECRMKENMIDAPEKDVLFDLILKMPISHVAKMYNVCAHTVTRWCRVYGLPSKKADIEKFKTEKGIDENNHKSFKKVAKYDLDGNLIETYPSMKNAGLEIQKTGKSKGSIRTIRSAIKDCCIGNKESVYGYRWAFV